MKKLFRLLLVCALLLSSCVSVNQDTPSRDGLPDMSAISQEEVSGTFPVSREDIIAADLTVPSGDTEGVKRWAEEWIRQCYKNNELYDIKAELKYDTSSINILRGMTVYGGEFEVYFKVGAPDMYLGAESDGRAVKSIWLYWIDDGHFMYFSSTDWAGQSPEISIYDYYYDIIKEDVRFSSLLNEPYNTTSDEGVTEYPIQKLSGNDIFMPVHLSDDVIAYIGCLFRNEDETYSYDIYAFDYINEKELFKLRYENVEGYPILSTEEGNVVLEHNYNNEGKDFTLKSTISPSGEILNEKSYDGDKRSYFLDGATCIVQKNHSLYLIDGIEGTERLLLEGTPINGIKDLQSYTFFAGIDNNRFIYVLHGYERIIRSGVYDISSFTDNVFYYNGEAGVNPLSYTNGMFYASQSGIYDMILAKEVLIANLNKSYKLTMPCKDILELARYINSQAIPSPDGSSVCVIMNNGMGVTVAMYNQSGIIKSWNIETNKCSIQYILSFSDEKIVLYGDGTIDGEDCLYAIAY